MRGGAGRLGFDSNHPKPFRRDLALINFISNLPSGLRSGGFSAMNVGALSAIRRVDAVHYVGPTNPKVSLPRKIFSKSLRMIHAPGATFFFYSEERLRRIAEEVYRNSRSDAHLDFFHGFTPWILTEPSRAFMAWNDCVFPDYIEIFHPTNRFSVSDLKRISDAEMSWLKRAKWLGFSSKWAANRAVSLYGLNPHKVSVVGIFGELEAPESDAYEGAKQ